MNTLFLKKESIFNDQNLFKNAKYETSNAISYKSKSNQTSHSSPFSNKSSKSFINQNDPINLANKSAYIIERDPNNFNFFKSARVPRIAKSIKSDEPLEKLFENYSNRELSMSFPMFFSQFDLRNQGDQVIDSDKNRECAEFYEQSPKTQRLSSVYAKARNKMKIKNNGIISKNVIFFKKYHKKQEELQAIAGYSLLNNAIAKRLQLFVNDAAFYQEGLLEKHTKPQFSAEKLIKTLFSMVFATAFTKIKGILCFFSWKNLDLRKNYQSLNNITTVFIVVYAIILPLNLGFNLLPSHFLAIDIIMLALLAIRLYHKKTEKKLIDYCSFLQIVSVFSYIFTINSLLSLFFVVLSFKELRNLFFARFHSPKLEISLIISFFQCILLANAMVCLWILVQNYYSSSETAWMSRQQLMFLGKDAKYLAIFNFVLTSPFSKDYNGLILEQLFGIFASFAWLALLLSEILNISHVFYQIKQEKIKKEYVFHKFH